jgi:hypothetical protein
MNESKITIDGDTRAFEPGATISGGYSWRADLPPKSVELRLFWFTRGKGDQDVRMVDEVRLDATSAMVDSIGDQRFSFNLPDGPYSFSGKLISLIWALELIVAGVKETQRVEFIVAPQGQELDLYGHGSLMR